MSCYGFVNVIDVVVFLATYMGSRIRILFWIPNIAFFFKKKNTLIYNEMKNPKLFGKMFIEIVKSEGIWTSLF